jgi:acetoin utilization deacetylase AcuC-like enzyme
VEFRVIRVFYTDKQVVDDTSQNLEHALIQSPSARKPKELSDILKTLPYVEIMEPSSITIPDIKLAHDADYVDGVMNLQLENGFGSKSKEVCDSLLYTNGCMYDAARMAQVNSPTCALVSGFHHAGHNGWRRFGYFCTFNGLIIAAAKLLAEGLKRVAILDCDQHWGNGTADILKHSSYLNDRILHISMGQYCYYPKHAEQYLRDLSPDECIESAFKLSEPDVIIYQAGADVHVNDPYGGVLNTEQIYQRDKLVFEMARRNSIPIAWNLAGGYQIESDGSISKVLNIHMNTFKACKEVFGF